jgi:hypothetical protein
MEMASPLLTRVRVQILLQEVPTEELSHGRINALSSIGMQEKGLQED